MLYENVVLESSKQVAAFLSAFRLKLAEFLARTVKAVWILDSELNVVHSIDHSVYSTYAIHWKDLFA